MSETETLEVKTEEQRILAWRAVRLYDLGFTYEQAKVLAPDSDFDLHKAEKMIRGGATHEQVIEILR